MLPRRDSKPLEHPALLPMFGGIEKKPRLLDREVITMGRARGSDICLDGNEVSALHCIIYHAAEGFRVRDCGSRTGTRVNGQGVKTGVLGNGDVLQIGPFSFEVRLPKGMSQIAAIDPFRFEKMRRSRSKLAQIALVLRKKLRSKKPSVNGHAPAAAGQDGAPVADSNVNDKKAAELKAKIKQYDQKVNQLEASEKELCDEQEALKKHKQDFEEQCKVREAAIAERQNRLEEEIQMRCATAQSTAQAEGQPTLPAALFDHGQESQDLQAKKQELEALEKKLKARDKELNDDYKEILKERDQVEKLKQQWELEQLEARKQFEQQQATRSSAEGTLSEQKAQLGAMIEQLRKMQDDLRVASSAETAQLKQQVAQLNKELAEARSHTSAASDTQGEVAQLREKLDVAQARVEALSLTLQQTNGLNAEVEDLQKEMQGAQARLQDQVQALQAENEGLRRQLTPGPDVAVSDAGDLDARLAQLQSENESLRSLAEQLQQHFAASDNGASASEELAILKNENEALRNSIAKAEQTSVAPSADNDEVQQENKVLRRLLDEAEADVRQLKNGTGGAGESDAKFVTLEKELQSLRDQLLEKDGTIAELKENTTKDLPVGDPESYEAELNRFRKELEADRARLNKEIESLRQRNSELDDATRELEMELWRERAEMARERIRLDRLRDEVKADMERVQREHDTRGALGSVQKLREEMAQKNGGPPKSAADRLRTMSKLP